MPEDPAELGKDELGLVTARPLGSGDPPPGWRSVAEVLDNLPAGVPPHVA